jgi:hypothetical protein
VVDLIFVSDPVVPFFEHEPVGKALPDGVVGEVEADFVDGP